MGRCEALLETKPPQHIYVWISRMLPDYVAGIAIAKSHRGAARPSDPLAPSIRATCSGVASCGDYCRLPSGSSVARTFSISRAHWSARDAIISRSRRAASG